jgi:hypothetical protein
VRLSIASNERQWQPRAQIARSGSCPATPVEIRGRDRAAAIERLESVLCARDNEYLYIGYATQMRAEFMASAEQL